MKGFLLSVLVVLPVLLLTGCEQFLLSADPEDSPESNFEFLWQELNNKYAYFDHKNIDWHEVYQRYRTKIHSEMDEKALFEVLSQMLNELRDGHVNLISSFDQSRNWSWCLDYPANFDEMLVYTSYLGEDYDITGALHNQVIDSVLYVYYSSFASDITQAHLDELLEKLEGLKGLIIDVRNNGGGSGANAAILAAVLTEKAYIYGHSRVKIGPDPTDFSAWKNLTIRPADGKRFAGNVVLLCNRRSYSASNTFALMLKSRSNVCLMGDNTGGGGGIPAYGELPNGWKYRFSASQTIDLNGQQTEDGIVVDIPVALSSGDQAKGIDTIIEAALEHLKNNN